MSRARNKPDQVADKRRTLVETGLGLSVQSRVQRAGDLCDSVPRTTDQELEQDLEAFGMQVSVGDHALVHGEEAGQGV